MNEGNERLKVLAICGSLRSGSYNRELLAIAKRNAAAHGAAVGEADLRGLALPGYDGDIEAAGFPEAVQRLKKDVEQADVLLIASPEYNHSVPGGLKNAIDWCSRGGNSFKGKWAAVMGASTGAYGTVRGQLALRQCLAAVNVLVLPFPQVFVAGAKDAFAFDGTLKDAAVTRRLEELVRATLDAARKMRK